MKEIGVDMPTGQQSDDSRGISKTVSHIRVDVQ